MIKTSIHWHPKIVSPAVMALSPWVFVHLLYSLRATTNLVPIPNQIAGLFITVAVGMLLLQAFISSQKRTAINSCRPFSLFILNKYIRYIGLLWILSTIFEIAYSGGLPVIWAFNGSEKDYTNFGIPSLHGVLNGLYFFLIGGIAINYLMQPTTYTKWYLIALICWPVLMLGRGILLTSLIQLLVLYLFIRGMKLAVFAKAIAIGLIAVVGFGVIGDIRGRESPFRYLVAKQYEAAFDALPSGFLWVYVYATAPLANYAFNAETVQPDGQFAYSSINLVPSLLRTDSLERADNFEFVDQNLNVSTIFASSHSDFGYLGDASLSCLLIVYSFYWYTKLLSSPIYILPYTMICAVLIFSTFYNLFLLYPYLFSTIVQAFIASRCVHSTSRANPILSRLSDNRQQTEVTQQ